MARCVCVPVGQCVVSLEQIGNPLTKRLCEIEMHQLNLPLLILKMKIIQVLVHDHISDERCIFQVFSRVSSKQPKVQI